MNKSELVEALASGAGVKKTEATRVLEAFVSTITETLKNGGQLVLPGFGSFSVGQRAARAGRNPQTGAPIQIKASKVAKFRAGKLLREAVQG